MSVVRDGDDPVLTAAVPEPVEPKVVAELPIIPEAVGYGNEWTIPQTEYDYQVPEVMLRAEK